jgi:hypothetical protein
MAKDNVEVSLERENQSYALMEKRVAELTIQAEVLALKRSSRDFLASLFSLALGSRDFILSIILVSLKVLLSESHPSHLALARRTGCRKGRYSNQGERNLCYEGRDRQGRGRTGGR